MASTARRKPVNLSIDSGLVAEARSLGVNISRACETGLAAENKRAREKAWLEEHGASLDGWTDYLERDGMPFAELRMF